MDSRFKIRLPPIPYRDQLIWHIKYSTKVAYHKKNIDGLSYFCILQGDSRTSKYVHNTGNQWNPGMDWDESNLNSATTEELESLYKAIYGKWELKINKSENSGIAE